jgi:hypothetical protein
MLTCAKNLRNAMTSTPMSIDLVGVVARRRTELVEVIESLRGRMGESERQVEGLFESLLVESFGAES